MEFAQVGWRDMDGLRMSVLGWETGPVPGVHDSAAIHLAYRDDSAAVIAAVSFYEHAGAVVAAPEYNDEVTGLPDRRIILTV